MVEGMTANLWKRGNPLLVCPHCGGAVASEQWRAADQPRRAIEQHRGQTREVRMVSNTPEWAALYAVQGHGRVTRYTCGGDCKAIIATLANDD